MGIMKITVKQLRHLIDEATGEGHFERVDGSNWEHLEVGNTYKVRVGSERIMSEFLGWFDHDASQEDRQVETSSENPEEVVLRFRDIKDGFEWDAYWFDGVYVAGSSAQTLRVLEM